MTKMQGTKLNFKKNSGKKTPFFLVLLSLTHTLPEMQNKKKKKKKKKKKGETMWPSWGWNAAAMLSYCSSRVRNSGPNCGLEFKT